MEPQLDATLESAYIVMPPKGKVLNGTKLSGKRTEKGKSSFKLPFFCPFLRAKKQCFVIEDLE